MNKEITSATVIGAGPLGSAVVEALKKSGKPVQLLGRELEKATSAVAGVDSGKLGDDITGDVVVLAVPYPAIDDVLAAYPGGFEGKIVIDPTNPIDFGTFESTVAEAGSSSARETSEKLPKASVVKAFNTNFAATLASGDVKGNKTTVIIAGDDDEAKESLTKFLEEASLRVKNAGGLSKACQLECFGALQINLAATEQISWTGGFAVIE